MRTQKTFLLLSVVLLVIFLVSGCPKKETGRETEKPVKEETLAETGGITDATTAEVVATTNLAEKPSEEKAVVEEKKEVAKESEKIPQEKATLKLGFSKNPQMPEVNFPHQKHAEEFSVACKTCHHNEGTEKACRTCHGSKKGTGGEITFKEAMHKNCIGCHKEKKSGPRTCNNCHVM